MTTLGQRIREHRRRAGMSQEALARQLAQAYACVEYVSCSECYGDSG